MLKPSIPQVVGRFIEDPSTESPSLNLGMHSKFNLQRSLGTAQNHSNALIVACDAATLPAHLTQCGDLFNSLSINSPDLKENVEYSPLPLTPQKRTHSCTLRCSPAFLLLVIICSSAGVSTMMVSALTKIVSTSNASPLKDGHSPETW